MVPNTKTSGQNFDIEYIVKLICLIISAQYVESTEPVSFIASHKLFPPRKQSSIAVFEDPKATDCLSVNIRSLKADMWLAASPYTTPLHRWANIVKGFCPGLESRVCQMYRAELQYQTQTMDKSGAVSGKN